MGSLNVNDALRNMGNNVALYRRVLAKFVETYADAAQTLKMLLAAGSKNEAERIVHTIKGLAGSIGAADLANRAFLLEQSIQASENETHYEQALQNFTLALDAALAACREVCDGFS